MRNLGRLAASRRLHRRRGKRPRSGDVGGGVRSIRSLVGAIAIRDVGFDGFGGGFSVAGFAQPHYRAGSHRPYQRIARLEHRTPLWMHEETVQPDRFGAAKES